MQTAARKPSKSRSSICSIEVHVIGAGNHYPRSRKSRGQNPPAFLATWRRQGEAKPNPENHLLFDLSISVLLNKVPGWPLHRFTRIAVTHGHPGHFAPFQFIWQLTHRYRIKREAKKRDIHLYAPRQALEFLRVGMPLQFPCIQRFQDLGYPEDSCPTMPVILPHEVHRLGKAVSGCVEHQDVIQSNDVVLEAIPVRHDFGYCEAVAYRLKLGEYVIAYSGDSGLSGSELHMTAMNADLFICETGFKLKTDVSSYGHLNAPHAACIAREAKVKQLAIFHTTGLESDKALMTAMGQHLPANIPRRVLHDGDRIIVA